MGRGSAVDFDGATFAAGAEPEQLLDLGTDPGQSVLNSVNLRFVRVDVERLAYTPSGIPLPPVTVYW